MIRITAGRHDTPVDPVAVARGNDPDVTSGSDATAAAGMALVATGTARRVHPSPHFSSPEIEKLLLMV